MKAGLDKLDEQITRAASAVDLANSVSDPSLYTAINGTLIRLRRVSSMIIMDAQQNFTLPKPPKIFMEEKGREVENPNDPNYIDALHRAEKELNDLAINVQIILGTKVEKLADGLYDEKSDEWVDELKAVVPQLEIPTEGKKRYLAWMKYHVLSDGDLLALAQALSRYNGRTLEKDVLEAQDNFRDKKTRNSSNGVSATDQH